MVDKKDGDVLKSSYERTGAEDVFVSKKKDNVHNISSSVGWILDRYRTIGSMPGSYVSILERRMSLLYSLVFTDGLTFEDDRKTFKVGRKTLELKKPSDTWRDLSRTIRIMSDISQARISELLGVSRQSFNGYETTGFENIKFNRSQLTVLSEAVADGLVKNNFDPMYAELVGFIYPLDLGAPILSDYIKSSDPSADLISKDGTRIQIKANRPTEWIITDNDPGVDLNDWNKLVDTMSKAYGNILREQGSKRVKKDDIRIMTLKEVMDEAIPDNFKEDLDSMSATAISGSYKRTLNKVRESINALQDDLLKVATYEHVYLKKQLGEHLHEKLFSKPNQAEVSVIQDALKDYDFKVDKYLDQRWNRIKAMDDLGSVLENMESSFLYGKKEEVKNARK